MSSNYFDLELLTNDPNLMKLCTEYWRMTEDGKFARTTTDIAKEFGISSAGLAKFVESYCTAVTIPKTVPAKSRVFR